MNPNRCPVCGLPRWDEPREHQRPPGFQCSIPECKRTDHLKTCGPLGERCPDHFVEP